MVTSIRSDHARFWTINNKHYTQSMPAVVLHDTGGHRGGMKECYHGPCDIYNHKEKHKNNIQWDFLVKTTQTLIDVVRDLSEAKCKSRKIFIN